MNQPITIALVDDHELFRKGLISLLAEFEFLTVIYESSNGKDLLKALNNYKPDIVLLDVEMPIMNGMETLRIIKDEFLDVRVIMLSMHKQAKLIAEFMVQGANGYLVKDCSLDILLETITGVYHHGYYFKQNMTANLVREINKSKILKDDSVLLTPREIEVINLICRGSSHKQIADVLFITARTVDFHKANIYKKTKANNVAKLYEFALANNLLVMSRLT